MHDKNDKNYNLSFDIFGLGIVVTTVSISSQKANEKEKLIEIRVIQKRALVKISNQDNFVAHRRILWFKKRNAFFILIENVSI